MSAARYGKRSDLIVHEQEPLNAETPRAALAAGPLTATDAFYVRDHGPVPEIDPAAWRLRIGGLVEQPVSLTYDELRALPHVQQVSDFHCVTGWSVQNVRWGGVRLGDVLARARPKASGHGLRFVSMEVPYVDYLTMPQASLHDVMLAYEMDGKPLAREHGAPLRLVIPEMYGYKNVKWLGGIDVVPRAVNGYWEDLGYDRNAWVGRSNGYGA